MSPRTWLRAAKPAASAASRRAPAGSCRPMRPTCTSPPTKPSTASSSAIRPATGDVPLFADFSSSIASEPLDISRYGLIYGGAQKNLGPVGISVVIVRAILLEREGQPRADIFDYRSHLKGESMLNTPPSWNWYLLGLTVKWMLAEGGVAEFARRNARKSALLYATIDGSGGFYRNEVEPAVRSRMNVPFFLHDAAPRQAIPRRGEGGRTDLAQGPSCARRHARLDLQRDAGSRRRGAGAVHARFPAATWLKRRTRSDERLLFVPRATRRPRPARLRPRPRPGGVAGEARAGAAGRAGLQRKSTRCVARGPQGAAGRHAPDPSLSGSAGRRPQARARRAPRRVDRRS